MGSLYLLQSLMLDLNGMSESLSGEIIAVVDGCAF